jgi:hypothetical protein
MLPTPRGRSEVCPSSLNARSSIRLVRFTKHRELAMRGHVPHEDPPGDSLPIATRVASRSNRAIVTPSRSVTIASTGSRDGVAFARRQVPRLYRSVIGDGREPHRVRAEAKPEDPRLLVVDVESWPPPSGCAEDESVARSQRAMVPSVYPAASCRRWG